MAGHVIERLAVLLRVMLFAAFVLALLLKTYGLYIAAALTPDPRVRRRLELGLRRTVVSVQQQWLRLPGR